MHQQGNTVMNPTLRLSLALFAGIIAAFITIALVETAGHALFPAPAGLDYADPAALKGYVDALPLAAKLFVLAAWLFGTVDGVFVACMIDRSRHRLCAGVIGTAVFLATAANLFIIPHPAWLAAAGLIGIPIAAFLTAGLCRRLFRPGVATHD